jgi:DNA repair protein RadA/Sms
LLLEVQSLTAYSQASAPRRVANGFDFNRLLMLAAVGSRRAGLELGAQDIIVNVAGGFRITEPAADLAVMLAMGSSLSNHPLPATLVAFGEVGLSGELRSVPQVERRLAEASRLGMTRSILPESGLQGVEVPRNMEVIPAKTVRQALRSVLTSNKWAEDFVLSSTLEES